MVPDVMRPQSLEYVIEKESMGVYRLEDGSTIRVKVVLMRAAFKGINSVTKLPEYDLHFQHVMDCEPGPNLIDTPLGKKEN